MILGVGIDLVQVSRIKRLVDQQGQKFLDRVFTIAEQQLATQRPAQTAATLAKRFAAKEAFSKATGFGIGQAGAFTDIEVVLTDTGTPVLKLHNAAKTHMEQRVVGQTVQYHLSLTDEADMAQAIVIIEATSNI